MNMETPFERLIAWRAAQAEADAPPAPRAGHLLERARPWWQVHPDRFLAWFAQLDAIEVRIGHAMEPAAGRSVSFPVPALIARTHVETSSLADILYFHLRGRTLRLRFQLHTRPELPDTHMEVTFVAAESAEPLLSAVATVAPGGEYRLEVDLPAAVANAWGHLRVTDRMPFRFILRPGDEG